MRLSFGKKCIKTSSDCEFALAGSSTLPAQVGPFTYCFSYVPSADFKVTTRYLLGPAMVQITEKISDQFIEGEVNL